jgi:hypothetical protein
VGGGGNVASRETHVPEGIGPEPSLEGCKGGRNVAPIPRPGAASGEHAREEPHQGGTGAPFEARQRGGKGTGGEDVRGNTNIT